jgi:hypothetical protein
VGDLSQRRRRLAPRDAGSLHDVERSQLADHNDGEGVR